MGGREELQQAGSKERSSAASYLKITNRGQPVPSRGGRKSRGYRSEFCAHSANPWCTAAFRGREGRRRVGWKEKTRESGRASLGGSSLGWEGD